MRRYSAAERAMYRYLVRGYTEIFSKACDEILTAACADYQSMAEAFQGVATAAREATKQVISDIIAEYLKERIIRPLLGDIPVTEELRGCTVTFRPDGA